MPPASLLVASFVIFAATYLAPGNPVAALSGGRSLPASSVSIWSSA
jgi:peptide/nickel transport system permease protein